MTPTAAKKKTLKPGQKWVYAAQVKDAEGNHPVHGDKWWIVESPSHPDGHYSTRNQAQDLLDRSKKSYGGGGKLTGFVAQIAVSAEPVLEQIDWAFITKWIKGKVVNPATVPSKYRKQYLDTLQRIALAAYRARIVVYANSSFRTLAEQQHLWAVYQSGGNLAAEPGTSEHELGRAADIQNARHMPKFMRECKKLGIYDDVVSEDWHLGNLHRV